MKKYVVTMLLALTCSAMLTGCQKKEEIADTETESVYFEPESETETEIVQVEKPKGINLLTGEAMDETLAENRPVAVMIGNTVDALPQYGTSQADVMYEVPVEGGLTRLMGIYQDYSQIERLGSVRSCRHYFAYYAMEFDAIYMHYGQAYLAEELLASGQVDDLNGLDGQVDNLAFYRDTERKAPHNAFTTSEGIAKAIEYKAYDAKYSQEYTGHFKFAADGVTNELTAGVDAAVVQPGYPIDKPWFVYHEEDGLYYRFQYKEAHTDATNNEQLAYRNVIFQNSNVSLVDTKSGYLDITTTGEGTGKYITNGKAIDITWKKENENSVTKYYDAAGNEIELNTGKTCVCIISNDSVSRVAIYATEAAFEEAQSAN